MAEVKLIKNKKKLDNLFPKRILVRGNDSIGDAILSLPAFYLLKEKYPDAVFYVVSDKATKLIYSNVDFKFHFVEHNRKDNLFDFFRLVRMLKSEHIDLAVLLTGSFQAALLSKLSKIPYRIGLNTDRRKFLLTHAVESEHHSQHQVLSYINVITPLFKSIPKKLKPIFHVSEDIRTTIDTFLSTSKLQSKNIITINPFASHPNKEWSRDNYSRLIELILKQSDSEIVITGSSDDYDRARKWLLRLSERDRITMTVGKFSLEEAAGLIKKSKLYIGNNSGIMHLAAAVNTPVVCLSGHSNLNMTAPYQENAIVFSAKIECVPCNNKTMERCKDVRCLNLINPEMVFERIKPIIS